MNTLVIAALVLVPIAAGLLFFLRAISSRQNSGISASGGLVLSPGKYRPMERLLQEDDFRFLSGQAGYTPRLGRRFRSERRRVFRAYLRSLKRDFSNLSFALRTLIVHSAEDRGDLAAAVVRQRLMFSVAMLAIEGRLLLHAAGVSRVTVNVGELVASLETMQVQMRELLTAPQAAMAGI